MTSLGTPPLPALAFRPEMIMLMLNCRDPDHVRPRTPERGEKLMPMKICWLDDLAKAQETARRTNRPILLDFYNPN